MTTPRHILPGNYWLLTRRTMLQLFMMRPEPVVNQIFEFCLARSADRYGIEPTAWEVMSNHYHLVVYDPKGNVPAFAQYLNRLLAAVFNAHLKRRENFWSSDELGLTLLATEADVMEKVVYTLGNAVKAKLVDSVGEWPGSSSLRFLDGKARRITRPAAYFSKKSVVPGSIELKIHQPRGSRKKETFAEWAKAVRKRVAKLDKDAAARRAANPKLRSLGLAAVLATAPTSRPPRKKNDERPKGKIRPRLACKEPRERKLRLRADKTFRFQHRQASKAVLNGETGVVFPKGTYRLPPGCVIGKCPPMPMELAKNANRIPCDDIVSTAPLASWP